MKEKGVLRSIGILLYVLTSFVDRIVYEIPDAIYIPIAIITIIIIIMGFICDLKNN